MSDHLPYRTYLLLADNLDRPLEIRPSFGRTALLAVAAGALIAGAPLCWASAADGAAAPVGARPRRRSRGDTKPGGAGTTGPTRCVHKTRS